MVLTGRERFLQHLGGSSTISVNELKEYLGTVPGGTTSTSDTIIKIVSTISISGHKVVVQSAGILGLADSSNVNHINKVVGITVDAVSPGAEANIQFRGYMDEPSWNWTLDLPIFVGLNGVLTQVVPVSGFSQQLATVISSTRILINIQEPIQIGD